MSHKGCHIKSIKIRIMVTLVAISCLVTALCTSLYYFQSLEHVEERLSGEARNSLVQLDQNMANGFQDVHNIVKPIFINRDVQHLLDMGNKDIEMLVSLRMLFSQLIDANHYIDNMMLLDEKFNKLFDIKAIVEDEKIYENLRQKLDVKIDNLLWFGPYKIHAEKSNESKTYYIKCMPIRKISNYDQIKGYLCVCIDENRIKDTYRNMMDTTKSNIAIINNGQIFSSIDVSLIGESITNLKELYDVAGNLLTDDYKIRENVMVTTYASKIIDYSYYRVDELNIFNTQKKNILQNAIIIITISLSLAFLLGFTLITNILSPLRELKDKMLRTEQGDFTATAIIYNHDEIGELAIAYNHMLNKIENLLESTKTLERKKRETELYVLQTQINPHFIYNTLTTIKWLAVKFGEEELSDLISNFGLVLRSSIALGQQFVTVMADLSCLESYIAIQKVRFQDQFDVQFHVDESIKKCVILKFMLQTLLENAIAHGVEPMEGKGLIQITCRREEDGLYFCVEDNGVGMPQEKLQQVRHRLQFEHFEGLKKSIGLLNLKERLAIYYGKIYRVYVESQEARGTKVYFYTPVEEEAKKFTLS